MTIRICVPAVALAAATVLAACSGGGLKQTSLSYTNQAETRHSYTPYETGSHAFVWLPTKEIYIGGDHEPKEKLRHVATENDILYFIGASRDGVGVDRLENYEADLLSRDDGFKPFTARPRVYLDSDFRDPENREVLRALVDSILILNDALPPEFQMIVAGFRSSLVANSGEIMVALNSPAGVQANCGADAAACARSQTVGDRTLNAMLHIPDDMDTSEYSYPRKVIVHEFLHALGIKGHVDSIEFPDSIMGSAGEYIPNLGHIIGKIDREVLQIMYMSQRTDLYNDWGEWSDTSHHLVGRSADGTLNFGVALFNGLPQPWVRGTRPEDDLADNKHLTGTATWEGALLGFSGPSPIAGDAEIEVDLTTLADPANEQDLRFRDIYFVNRIENADRSDTSPRWFPTRNIDYKVAVSGNWFVNVRKTGYEPGLVTGAFMGDGHEYMGGTVKRTDLVGAFGGSRQ